MSQQQSNQPISLRELNQRITNAVAYAPGVQNVWVVAETLDLRVTNGHCYLELIDKDPNDGKVLARMRATIWGQTFARMNAYFQQVTGSALTSNIKIMVQVQVSFHTVYGIAANIVNIHPQYTLGDLMRRRQEMLARLQAAGIINQNRQLGWPEVPWRIAVISAQGAAGYGDFINQLYTNPHRLRFSTRLFTAAMQGENAAPSIISALERIAVSPDEFDCVVIIRGGGATGDLAAFDHYELASSIATFPLPVVVGIGHERDITLLDYVANMRVKTPTAAAEWLIGRGMKAIDRLRTLGRDILDAASARLNANRRRLDTIAGQLPELTRNAIQRNAMRIGPAMDDQLNLLTSNVIKRRGDRLEALAALIDTLSPQATLRRGFSITRVDGKAIVSPDQVEPGATVETTLANGTLLTIGMG